MFWAKSIACFLGALQLVAKNKNTKLSDDVKIKAAVSIGVQSL
jgi:organic hydroperoxide reductase OsmC/OhrA